ncbi:MAG: hypothetical protein H7A53_00090 [Akkermansiaceae bacterium]|nr:hypothetical protein [Akkermansiaceae bacterium]
MISALVMPTERIVISPGGLRAPPGGRTACGVISNTQAPKVAFQVANGTRRGVATSSPLASPPPGNRRSLTIMIVVRRAQITGVGDLDEPVLPRADDARSAGEAERRNIVNQIDR